MNGFVIRLTKLSKEPERGWTRLLIPRTNIIVGKVSISLLTVNVGFGLWTHTNTRSVILPGEGVKQGVGCFFFYQVWKHTGREKAESEQRGPDYSPLLLHSVTLSREGRRQHSSSRGYKLERVLARANMSDEYKHVYLSSLRVWTDLCRHARQERVPSRPARKTQTHTVKINPEHTADSSRARNMYCCKMFHFVVSCHASCVCVWSLPVFFP